MTKNRDKWQGVFLEKQQLNGEYYQPQPAGKMKLE